MDEVHQHEIDRMFRISDLMITVHSTLRDRYAVRARATEILLLVAGALVAALTFLDPTVARVILPSSVPPSILVGLVGIGVFAASLVQIKIDWSGRSALHGRAADAYTAMKHELGRAKYGLAEESTFVAMRGRYEAIGPTNISVPDRLFPRLKRIHRLKVEISKTLDSNPGTSILLLRWKLWWRDNISGGKS